MSSVFLWFLPLARQQDCILEYILPTKPKRANGGGSKYWDKKYNGTGNTSVNYVPLCGGVGDLTDGIIPTQNWNDVEVADGTGLYVG
ncbi:hypothetical protein C789_3912 [Microcystis aeruginosa FACHB-905 = DIANCHI905]|uniref:Genome sequencing data, contig C306 n=1 Tax=Microcystis aeruginosa (strain PCC 7806) TaxID=267872 RepID=A8YFU9_MICA7|nr:hypothetical protein C789_3912 [Microcystis aeruginosa FACHB-905 = DIANCHI905]CAO89762.1 unnamed protein product [Microcystis aeruginosa PCC 7806]